jgi:hypothetical protein
LPTNSDPEAARLWRRQVAEAAGLAADELADDDRPQFRQLYADLRGLEARLADDEPSEAGDPRRGAD